MSPPVRLLPLALTVLRALSTGLVGDATERAPPGTSTDGFGPALRVLFVLAFLVPASASSVVTRGSLPVRALADNEYRIKAAFLYNFVKYTTWPKDAFGKDDDPLVLAVVGKDPFGEELEQTLGGKTVGKRAIVVRRLQKPEEALKAHIVFCGEMPAAERTALVEKLAGKPVLLVGEVAGFAAQGATANFYLEYNKVRFEINVEAAKRARLELSSELLKLAKLVKEEKR